MDFVDDCVETLHTNVLFCGALDTGLVEVWAEEAGLNDRGIFPVMTAFWMLMAFSGIFGLD